MFRFLRRMADKELRRQLAEVQAELEAECRKLSVAETEIKCLAGVIARDRERVKAELADASKRIADATTVPHKK